MSYDALLVLSFGGPEGMDDVLPFLENVTKGRNVPRERLLNVAKHYELFAGVSPINAQNRALIASLKKIFQADRQELKNLPIYWGNRNWHPFLAETFLEMKRDNVKKVLVFVTSAYSSYSSCKQYLEDILKAQDESSTKEIQFDKIRPYFNHPLFIEANISNLELAFLESKFHKSKTHVLFSAHSIPLSMAKGCSYEEQLSQVAKLCANALHVKNWKLVYQSRSGPPSVPWLGPDICEYLQELKENCVEQVIVHPIGFVSDHMEIIYDLDTEAQKLCQEIGLEMHRAKSVGVHAKFIEMIKELVLERIETNSVRPSMGELGTLPDECFIDCCPQSVK